MFYALFWDFFILGSVCCALMALHRVAASLKLRARVEAYEELQDVFTVEEREALVHKIKVRTLQG